MIMKRQFSFILNEADADDVDEITNGNIDAGDTPPEAGGDNAAEGANDDGGDDADLNIDASLDGTGDDDNINDDLGGGTDTSSSGGDSFGGSSSSSTDEEPLKNNTNIFSNLTSEEQAIKIAELKRLYDDLYTSCDDYIARFNDVDYDNIPISVVERVSSALGNLRQYIRDYILHVFPIKTYIENDYKYNEFLYVFHSIASILEDIPTNTDSKKS